MSSSGHRTSFRAATVATALTVFLSHIGLSQSNCPVSLRVSGFFALACLAFASFATTFALAVAFFAALALASFAGPLRRRGSLQVVAHVLEHIGMPGAALHCAIRAIKHMPVS